MTVPCICYCDTFFEKKGKDFVCTTVLGIHPTKWHTHKFAGIQTRKKDNV